MLVSHQHKFIYTKTLKTAGTSIEVYFERYCMPRDEWVFTHQRAEYVSDLGIIGFRGLAHGAKMGKWWNHMPAALIRERLGEEKWNSYFKFCAIRNPYEKALSAFCFYRSENRRKTGKPDPGGLNIDWDDLEIARAKFEAWLQVSRLPNDRDTYVIDGQFCLDDVIRHETLQKDADRICERLRIPWEPEAMPRIKSEYRPPNTRAEDLYTEKSKSIVAATYAFELEYFGYSFPVS